MENGKEMMDKKFINLRYIPIFVVVFLSYFIAVFFDAQILNDGDVFLHIAAGQWILQHHAVPHVDPFSYSFAQAPWVAHEWLAEVFMALAYAGAGWGGVCVLAGLAYTLAMGSMVVFVVQRGASLLAIGLVCVCSLVLTFPSLLARPHLLALPCFVLWNIFLLRAREKGNAPPPWPVALLLLVWANLHGSFAIGLMLILPFAFEAVLAAQRERLRVMGLWGRFMLLSCITVAITPNGWHGLFFPVQLLMQPQLAMIREWAPIPIPLIGPFVLATCMLVYVAITRRLKMSLIRWLLLIGFGYFSLRHFRYELLSAVFVPLILAAPLGRLAANGPGGQVTWRGTALQWSALVAVVGMLTGLRMAYPYKLMDQPQAPMSAIEHIPAGLRALPVLNSYGLGGILIFEGMRPVIDGRADMYGHDFMQEHSAVMAGDKKWLQAWETEFDLQWAFLAPKEALVNVLDSDPQWRRLYTSRYAIVYAKNSGSRFLP